MLFAVVALSGCASLEAQSTRVGNAAIRLDHVTVYVDDVDAASKFLTETVGWRRHPQSFVEPARGGLAVKADRAFIDANGFWIELVTATSAGPETQNPARQGGGQIGSLVFETRAFDRAVQSSKGEDGNEHGDGAPLVIDRAYGREPARAATSRDLSIRSGHWPKEMAYGTVVEFYEGRPWAARDVFTARDRAWRRKAYPANSPRLDRIAIIVADAERTARFYTDVVGLQRHPETFRLEGGANARSGGMQVVFVEAGAVWLALVQPVGPGPLMDYLNAKGDGYIAELIAEVDDLGGYYDAMKARGIHMVDTSGNPLDDREKAHVLEPFGDRIAYFPTSVSQGIVLEVAQRGPEETSLIAKRDTWRR